MAKELLFLVGSIASTSVVSFFLSLSLAIRSFFSSSPSPSPSPSSSEQEPFSVYEGRVWHVRRVPVHHAFDYPVRYALFDLDRSSHSFHSPGHGLSADEARRATGSNGPVLLLTIPKSVGYEQNPLSVYYCFHRKEGGGGEEEKEEEKEEIQVADGGRLFLKSCIAEVTNTPWGERVNFVFRPGKDLVAKPLHVSPFMDMMGSWSMHADPPGESLRIMISVQHPTLGNYFTATLSARRVPHPLSPIMLASYFWLMPHKVAIWIYWHALKLWWKGVSFIGHPKYMFPTYREVAVVRNRELQSSFRCGRNDEICCQHEKHKSIMDNSAREEDRWCIWTDARWPWS